MRKGLFISVDGPNGAGKTTTMQMITGTLAPSNGQITVAGYDMLDDPIQAKMALGYLPEQPPLYRDMPVDEFLTFCARLHQIPRREVDEAPPFQIPHLGVLGAVDENLHRRSHATRNARLAAFD